MRRTCVAMPSYSGAPQALTKESLRRIRPFGHHLVVEGVSDVALARSILLTAVCDDDRCVSLARVDGEYDVVLCIDDDMAFEPQTAQRLVNRARETRRAVSACYMTGDQRAAAAPWPEKVPSEKGPAGERVYLTGLGLCAIPTILLLQLKRALPRVNVWGDKTLTPFCRSHADVELGVWHSEDMWLSRDLGGFLLEPVPAAHVKRFPLWPDQRDIDALCAGGDLQVVPDEPLGALTKGD
jgi:hypothetical protein